MKQGSAYDLFLTRTLEHATIVRGSEGVDVFAEQGLEVGAGIRQPVVRWASSRPDVRVVDEPFMQIQQAVGVRRDRSPATVTWLHDLVEELKAAGSQSCASGSAPESCGAHDPTNRLGGQTRCIRRAASAIEPDIEG